MLPTWFHLWTWSDTVRRSWTPRKICPLFIMIDIQLLFFSYCAFNLKLITMLWIRIRIFMDLPDSEQHYLYKKKSWKLGSGSRSGSGWKVGYRSRTAYASKKKNPDPDPDLHQGNKSNPDPHQSEVDPQHCAKQSRVRIQLWIWFFFFCRCCSGLWSYVIDFFIFHSWIYLVHKVLSRFKKKIQPSACSVCMCSHFFSPWKRA